MLKEQIIIKEDNDLKFIEDLEMLFQELENNGDIDKFEEKEEQEEIKKVDYEG